MIQTSLLVSDYLSYTKDNSNANREKGKRRIAHYYQKICAMMDNHTVEKTRYIDQKASQRSYLFMRDYLANGCRSIASKYSSGYVPMVHVPDTEQWQAMKVYASSSTVPTHFHIFEESGSPYFEVWPLPSADLSVGFEIVYAGYLDPLYFPSDVTGGVGNTVALSAGSQTVTGTGTSFTSSMVGLSIKPANGKFWYPIRAYASATSLTLVNSFEETTLSGSDYTIAEVTLLPQEAVYTPVYFATAEFYGPVDKDLAQYYQSMAEDDVRMLQERYSAKTTGRVTPGIPVGSSRRRLDPYYPTSPIIRL